MAPRLPRRPRAGEPENDDELVRLDDDAHAWWAQRPAEDLLKVRRPPPQPPEPPRDILAEHFGPDWRTSWGFDPPPSTASSPDEALAPEPAPPPLTPPAWATDDPRPTTTPPGGEPADEGPTDDELADGDGYAVLGVAPTATWEEIVAAHRAMARRHHPDRVATQGPDAVAAAEERIRRVNAAYAELRIRRGR